MAYAAIFDGCNLLSLRPLNFEEERRQTLMNSLQNPTEFNKFFNLKSKYHKKEEALGVNTNNPRVMRLVDPNLVKDFLPCKSH